MFRELSPEELQRWREAGTPFELLDVRDADELAIASLDGSRNIPMAQIVQRAGELPQDRPIVVLCHHGQRSARVAAMLSARGFADVYSVAGGIDAYRERVDPTLAAY